MSKRSEYNGEVLYAPDGTPYYASTQFGPKEDFERLNLQG